MKAYTRRVGTLLCAWALASAVGAAPASFDLRLQATPTRAVDVQVVFPEGGCAACPLVVFSHGAYAAPERYARLLRGWAEAGYVVAAPLHLDSELHPEHERYPPNGAPAVVARLEDFVSLTESERLRKELAERCVIVRDGVIAAGHSFGALIAQAAGGARLQQVDPAPAAFLAVRERVLGVVALSPPGSAPGYFEKADWALVERPMLVVTGTTDIIPGFFDDWRVHLDSFEAAQKAPAYALVFAGQDHYFNGAYGRPKEVLSPDTTAALVQLTASTVTFMEHLGAGKLPAAKEWVARSGPGVEARASTP